MTPPLRFPGPAQRRLVAEVQRGRGRCVRQSSLADTGTVEVFPSAALDNGAGTGGAGGFTIIELLIGMTVLAIIAGLDVLLLQTGMDAWSHASTRVTLQRASDELMENLLEGGFDGEGIRDAVELKEASATAIGFVPLWTDRSHQPDPVRNKDQKFVLERQFKPGAPTPISQMKKPDSSDFVSAPVKFTFGVGRDPKAPDDVVQFVEPIPLLSELKVIYTPDGDMDSEVIKVFRWDPATSGSTNRTGERPRTCSRRSRRSGWSAASFSTTIT